MSRSGVAAGSAYDRAFADWLEAEALVAALRCSARAAAERASERARDAMMLARAGRGDAFAMGVADAAGVLAARAAAEARRLDEALRAEALLRARVVAVRSAGQGPDPAAERIEGAGRCA